MFSFLNCNFNNPHRRVTQTIKKQHPLYRTALSYIIMCRPDELLTLTSKHLLTRETLECVVLCILFLFFFFGCLYFYNIFANLAKYKTNIDEGHVDVADAVEQLVGEVGVLDHVHHEVFHAAQGPGPFAHAFDPHINAE